MVAHSGNDRFRNLLGGSHFASARFGRGIALPKRVVAGFIGEL